MVNRAAIVILRGTDGRGVATRQRVSVSAMQRKNEHEQSGKNESEGECGLRSRNCGCGHFPVIYTRRVPRAEGGSATGSARTVDDAL